MCADLNYDDLGLTETHDRGTHLTTAHFIPGDPASTLDRAAGVALMLSQRVARCVIHSGCIGSRIVYARIRAAICHIFIVCVYVPHSQHSNPSRATTLEELEKLLKNVPHSDCIMLLGDMNSCLPRSYEKLTGRWCVHKNVDRHGGGNAILDLMRRHSLVAASTLHKTTSKAHKCNLYPMELILQAASNRLHPLLFKVGKLRL